MQSGFKPTVLVKRVGTEYQLLVHDGVRLQQVASSTAPIFLPTLFSSEILMYAELRTSGATYFMQDLASGQRWALTYAISNACIPEVIGAEATIKTRGGHGLPDEMSSQPAEGPCRSAFDREFIRTRYTAVKKLMRERKYIDAKSAYIKFIESYPASDFVANAFFESGVADYALGDYRAAAASFRQVRIAPATKELAANALLAASDCAFELGERGQSRTDLTQLATLYPDTSAALIARRRLDDKAISTASEAPSEPPRLAIEPMPAYPLLSKRLGETGRAVVQIMVTTNGQSRDASIRVSSGFPRLDQAAIDSLQGAYFFPARTRVGEKRDMLINVPINFVLKD